jgi:hypothetical protein
MNLIYIIQVQDGSDKRYEYQAVKLPDTATKVEIDARGEQVTKELFTGEQDGEWYWDSYGVIAGRYYSYKVIPCDVSFGVIEGILI